MAAGTRVGSIYVSVGADYTQYAKDLNALKQQAKADGLAISNSLNNSISPSQAHKSITSLNAALAQLSATAKAPSDAFRTTSDQISKSLSSVAQSAGMSEQAFARLNERIMRGQAMQNAEKAMSGIAKSAGYSSKEVHQLAMQMGFSQKEAANLASRVNAVDKSFQGAGKSARSFTTILNTTVSILAGMAIGTVIEAISRGFGGAVKTAFSFNQTIEQSRIGIAALERTFTDVDMAGSFREAEEIQKRLQVAALETTATYEELLRALQEGIGPALREGFDASQIVEFTTLMTQAAASISLPMNQLGQELRAILDGTIDRNARIAKVLQITNEDVKGWREAGTLFEELRKRLEDFSAAGEQMSHTFTGAFSNLKDAMQMALGQGLEGTFVATTTAIEKFRDQIVTIDKESGTFTFDERLQEAFSGVDESLSSLVSAVSEGDLIGKIVAVADAISALSDAIVFLSKLQLPELRIPGSWDKAIEILGKLGSAWIPDRIEKAMSRDTSKITIADINADWESGKISELARIGETLEKINSLKERISARNGGESSFSIFPDTSDDIYEINRLETEIEGLAGTLPRAFESAGSEIKRVVVDGSIDQVVRENYVQSWGLIGPAASAATEEVASAEKKSTRMSDEEAKARVSLLKKSIKDEEKAREEAVKSAAKQHEELTDKIMQLTLSEVEYKRWALGKELSDRQANGAQVEELEQYKALRLQEINDDAAKKEMDDRRDKAKKEVDLLRDQLKEESDLREEYTDELFELTHTEAEIYEKSVDEKVKSLKKLGLSEGELARYKTLLIEKNRGENDEITKFIEQRWAHALDSIQDGLAEWIKTGEFSFDRIVDIFKDMLAEMLAAWIMTKGKMAIADLFDGGGFSWGGLLGDSSGGGGGNYSGLLNYISTDMFTSDSTGLTLYDYMSEGETLQGISDIYGSGSGGGSSGGGGTGVLGTAVTAGKAVYSYIAEKFAAEKTAEVVASKAAETAATNATSSAAASQSASGSAAGSGAGAASALGWAGLIYTVVKYVAPEVISWFKPIEPHDTYDAASGGNVSVSARSNYENDQVYSQLAVAKLYNDLSNSGAMWAATSMSGLRDNAGIGGVDKFDAQGMREQVASEMQILSEQTLATLEVLRDNFGDQMAGMAASLQATAPGFDAFLDRLTGTNVSASTAAKSLELATSAYRGNASSAMQLRQMMMALGMSEQQAAALTSMLISAVGQTGAQFGLLTGAVSSTSSALGMFSGALGGVAGAAASALSGLRGAASEVDAAGRAISMSGGTVSGSTRSASLGGMVVAPKGTSAIYGSTKSLIAHAVGGIYLKPTLMADAYGDEHKVAEAGWSEAILPLPGGPRTMDEIYGGVKQLAAQSQQPIVVKVQLPEKIAVMIGQREIEGVIVDIADKQQARREQSLIRAGQPACR